MTQEAAHMRKRWTLGAAAALVAVSFAAPASAAGPTRAELVGAVQIDSEDPTVAYITANYRCYGEGALWVSVKQVADRSRDTALLGDGSSGISAAWSMSHRVSVTCDGKVHVQTFMVDQFETDLFGFPNGDLEEGFGYVQFCLFDDNYPNAPLSDMELRRVHD
jgi:hypothetical protein